MNIKAVPSHRFIHCGQRSRLLCPIAEEKFGDVVPAKEKSLFELTDLKDEMSTDKIKHFYVTVSVVLSSVFMLLVLYGCYTYRKLVKAEIPYASLLMFQMLQEKD